MFVYFFIFRLNNTMSSTITETERRSVPSPTTPAETLTNKRQHLARTGSIEKLKKFNSYICSQHYYILPSLLLWLKTSQTILTSNMEKCIAHLKSMFLICTIRDVALFRCAVVGETKQFGAFYKLTAGDVLPVLNILTVRLCAQLLTVYEYMKYLALVVSVYFAVFLVFLQLVGCVLLICLKMPPLGFVFLVLCVAFMGHIAAQVMFTCANKREKQNTSDKQMPSGDNAKDKRKLRKRLSLIGKTISNIKLF